MCLPCSRPCWTLTNPCCLCRMDLSKVLQRYFTPSSAVASSVQGPSTDSPRGWAGLPNGFNAGKLDVWYSLQLQGWE